jgi:hypothetical protein
MKKTEIERWDSAIYSSDFVPSAGHHDVQELVVAQLERCVGHEELAGSDSPVFDKNGKLVVEHLDVWASDDGVVCYSFPSIVSQDT